LVYIDKKSGSLITFKQQILDFNDYQGLKLVDTCGAGDSYTAGFAVGILEGMSEQDAMLLGTQTAFLNIS
jgi:sugar/nucleoside kinase (ribokinase family)